MQYWCSKNAQKPDWEIIRQHSLSTEHVWFTFSKVNKVIKATPFSLIFFIYSDTSRCLACIHLELIRNCKSYR
jgi:hypothetical protein